MIVRSPRPSDGTEATCLCPVHPVKTYVFPWLVPGVQNPFPRQDANMSPFTDVQSAWTFSPPKEKIQFSKMGWAQARWALVFPQSHSPRAGSASGGKRGSVPKAARFHDLLPRVGCQRDTFRELQTAQHAVPRGKQDEAEAGKRAHVPRTPHAGDQGQNEKYRWSGKASRQPKRFEVWLFTTETVKW